MLILGERYGWIPQTGPQSHEGLSVTHLEYKQARSLGIPILPFLKKLDFETSDRESEDAQKRNAFRTEVSDWAEGQSVAPFELAGDLADSVGQSLVALLSDEFLTRQIRARAPQAARTLRQMENAQSRPATKPRVQIPSSLATAAANREAVMFAGAGISWAGGMPSAAVFSQHLAEVLIHTDPDYAVSPAGSMMKAIASDLEASTSREFLVREIGRILDPPQGLHATVAHEKAIKLFDLILTTNWDGLFEEAATMQNEDFTLITREISAGLPRRAIVKLQGSHSDPESLLLTESDAFTMDLTRPRLWESVRDIVHIKPLAVVGTSLRDPSVVRLFEEARPGAQLGYLVVRSFSKTTEARVKRWNLECIAADADVFLTSLADCVGR